jgi:hypothetical protein
VFVVVALLLVVYLDTAGGAGCQDAYVRHGITCIPVVKMELHLVMSPACVSC